MENGCLIAAPIPEEYMNDGLEIQTAVEQAIRESEENGMSKRGKEVTPWLLARVTELTGGKSLRNSASP
jgi:pseudouridine-5'-phosphate glycosidase/pseudouridine kinase